MACCIAIRRVQLQDKWGNGVEHWMMGLMMLIHLQLSMRSSPFAHMQILQSQPGRWSPHLFPASDRIYRVGQAEGTICKAHHFTSCVSQRRCAWTCVPEP